MRIEIQQRITFRAPTRGRSFFTARAAANAEAGAMIRQKYPTEPDDQFGGGWHWSGDERLLRLHARLVRLLLRQVVA